MNFNDRNELGKVGVIPQKQAGYYVIRLKAVAGNMSTEQLRCIAEAADKYADGKVHLTMRQGFELHNIPEGSVAEAKTALEEAGIEMGASGPRVRGIIACPGAETCPHGIIDTRGLAEELDKRYFGQEGPGKFKIAVSGCPNDCTKPMENDVGIMGGVLPRWEKEMCIDCGICAGVCPTGALAGDNSGQYVIQNDKCILCGVCINNCPQEALVAVRKGYTLYLGGTMGKKPRLGTRAKTLIQSREELFRYIDRAIDFYKKQGKKKERFGHTIDRIGVDKTLIKIIYEE